MAPTVAQNHKRISTFSICTDASSSSTHLELIRETAENKLYYLKDTMYPHEFEEAVDEELERAVRNANEEYHKITFNKTKDAAKKLFAKLRKDSARK